MSKSYFRSIFDTVWDFLVHCQMFLYACVIGLMLGFDDGVFYFFLGLAVVVTILGYVNRLRREKA